MNLSDYCQWCGAGRLCVPDDDRCRSCIEDGILPETERPSQYRWTRAEYDQNEADFARKDV